LKHGKAIKGDEAIKIEKNKIKKTEGRHKRWYDMAQTSQLLRLQKTPAPSPRLSLSSSAAAENSQSGLYLPPR